MADQSGGVAIAITPTALATTPDLPPDWFLSQRERSIALAIIHGRDVGTIAAEQFISPSTVNWHLANIFERLGVNGRSGLMARFFMDVMYPGVDPFSETGSVEASTQP
jgi:DNA-binding CsgD family transcriptional regulator